MKRLKSTLIVIAAMASGQVMVQAQSTYFYNKVVYDSKLTTSEKIKILDSTYAAHPDWYSNPHYGYKHYVRWKNQILPYLDEKGTTRTYHERSEQYFSDNIPMGTPVVHNQTDHMSMPFTSGKSYAEWKPFSPTTLVPSYDDQGNVKTEAIGKLDRIWPHNASIIYAASDKGGLFKTIDGGQNWKSVPINFNTTSTSIFPDYLGVRALAVDKNDPDIVYVSTCHGYDVGAGVFKTTNGGDTWTRQFSLSLDDDQAYKDHFLKIVIDPNNSQRLYAISNSKLFVATNAGDPIGGVSSWSEVHPNASSTYFDGKGLKDIEIDKLNSDIVYVSGKSIWKVDMTTPSSPTVVDYRTRMQNYSTSKTDQYVLSYPRLLDGPSLGCKLSESLIDLGWTGDLDNVVTAYADKWRNVCFSHATFKTGILPTTSGQSISTIYWYEQGNKKLEDKLKAGLRISIEMDDLFVPPGIKFTIEVSNANGDQQIIYDSEPSMGYSINGQTNLVEFIGLDYQTLAHDYDKLTYTAKAIPGSSVSTAMHFKAIQFYTNKQADLQDPGHNFSGCVIDLDNANNLYAWIHEPSPTMGMILLRGDANNTSNHAQIIGIADGNDIESQSGFQDAFIVTKSPSQGQGIELYVGSVELHKFKIDITDLDDETKNYRFNFPRDGQLHPDYRDFHLLGTDLYVAHDGGPGIINDAEQFDKGVPLTDFESIAGDGLTLGHFWSIDYKRTPKYEFAAGGVMHQGTFYKKHDENTWFNNFSKANDGGDVEIDVNWDGVTNKTNIRVQNNGGPGRKDVILNTSNGERDANDVTNFYTSNNAIPSTFHNLEQSSDGTYYMSLSNVIHTSTDGITWTPWHTFASGEVIQAIEIAPSDPNTIFVALQNPGSNKLWRRTASTSWTAINVEAGTDKPYQDYSISDIAVSHSDPNILWVTYERFHSGDNLRVFRSSNALGTSVTFINADPVVGASTVLPDLPAIQVETLPYSDQQIFVGTAAGLYYGFLSTPTSTTWNWELYAQFQQVDWAENGPHFNLPLGRVADIEIDPYDSRVITSIYGRGLWSSHLPCIEKDATLTIDITQNTTWTNESKRFDSDIHVKANTTLTIDNCNLYFAPDVKIVVEEQGHLIVNNSNLTNSCEKEWDGILVYGFGNNAPQTDNGKVEVDNSIIQNGEYGIRVGDNTGNSGGLVYVENSTFRNCHVGISYYLYSFQNEDIQGHVKQSTFICDGPVPGHNGEGVHAHIGLYAVRGLLIEGCMFYNTMNQDDIVGGDKGIGIDVWDGSFFLRRQADIPNCTAMGNQNHFEGLDYGIKLHGGSPQLSYVTQILEANFVNNRRAISILNQQEPLIWNTTIEWKEEVMPVLNSSNTFCYGVILDGAIGFELVDNVINFQNTEFNFEALRIKDSYDPWYSSLVQNNQFQLNSGLKDDIVNRSPSDFVGTIFDGDNSSLYLNCNMYTDYFTDWFLNDPIAVQESSLGANLDPGNSFSNPCFNLPPGQNGSSYNSIYVDPWLANGVDYAQFNLPASPLCTEGGVTFIAATDDFGGCGSMVRDGSFVYCPPEGSGGEGGEGEGQYSTIDQTDSDKDNAVEIYPNPSYGQFTVSVRGLSDVISIEVLSITGEKIFSKTVNQNLLLHDLNLAGLAQGIYMVRVNTANESHTKPVIIK